MESAAAAAPIPAIRLARFIDDTVTTCAECVALRILSQTYSHLFLQGQFLYSGWVLIRSLIPEEKDVCHRLKRLRMFSALSQSSLAKAVGLTRDQLANIEIARTPLKFWQGWKVCKVLNINQGYLAFGKQPLHPFTDFDPIESASSPITEQETFRDVCQAKLWEELDFRNMLEDSPAPAVELTGQDSARSAEAAKAQQNLVWFVKTHFTSRPQNKRLAEAAAFVEEIKAALQLDDDASGFAEKTQLTNSATSGNVESMQGKWPALKKQLQAATEKTGKSALAKFLKVDLTRVSQWLTDAKSQREPGAEYALQMQDWLKRQT